MDNKEKYLHYLNTKDVDRVMKDNSELVRQKVGIVLTLLLLCFNVFILSPTLIFIAIILMAIIVHKRIFALDNSYMDEHLKIKHLSKKPYILIMLAVIALELSIVLAATPLVSASLISLYVAIFLLSIYAVVIVFGLDIIKE